MYAILIDIQKEIAPKDAVTILSLINKMMGVIVTMNTSLQGFVLPYAKQVKEHIIIPRKSVSVIIYDILQMIAMKFVILAFKSLIQLKHFANVYKILNGIILPILELLVHKKIAKIKILIKLS